MNLDRRRLDKTCSSNAPLLPALHPTPELKMTIRSDFQPTDTNSSLFSPFSCCLDCGYITTLSGESLAHHRC
ncbi:Hypothetical predicted protein [Scomber scombrus]|uniref:Uncharacterized protein n=1 Tax=Scomber scombrus TaxID=13677 RepID=A0AAV1PMR1_SCOSC